MGTRISTWNVNGLRSAVRQGFESWLSKSKNDIVCLQEVKLQQDLLTRTWFHPFEAHWNTATKRGYSGVATLISNRLTPPQTTCGMGDVVLDSEGRVLTTEFSSFVVVNAYAPHSHRKLLRLEEKRQFGERFSAYIRELKSRGKPLIVVGDLNVAHQEVDLSNPVANRKNAGFLPEEREWMTGLLGDGLVDAFRLFQAGTGHFTWWSIRRGVRQRNIGWRLDYILVDQSLAERVLTCFHSPQQLGSDHCPVTIDIDV